MKESDRLSFGLAILIGLSGLAILVRLDLPVIMRGDWQAGFGVLELLSAVTLLSLSLAVAAHESRQH